MPFRSTVYEAIFVIVISALGQDVSPYMGMINLDSLWAKIRSEVGTINKASYLKLANYFGCFTGGSGYLEIASLYDCGFKDCECIGCG
jgi:hypothetical protein